MIALLFVEGVLTFVSPCLLPLLPLYVAYFAAGQHNRRRTLLNALGFVLGFALVFTALGAFAGTLGALLLRHRFWVNIITGLVVAVLGLSFLGLFQLPFLHKLQPRRVNTQNMRFGKSIVFGLTFAAALTPCAGPMLGIALMQAAQAGGTLQGMLLLLVYSLGLGLPLVLCAMLMDHLKGVLAFLRRHQNKIHKVAGVLLILLGIAMMLGLLERIT
ncbi:MAG: cytochrome c biogenesis protein CcdA [Oscillospiraceae bacterium]|nr:cytochrome c biogenesis protein CcdA [Oscillospiraceae bacterium]